MKCQNCGKNDATIHIKQVINGQSSEKHLCENCLNSYNTNEFELLNNIDNSMHSGIFSQDIIGESIVDNIIEDMIIADTMLTGMIATEPRVANYGVLNSNNILDQAKKSIINGAIAQEKKYADNPNLKEIERLQVELKSAVDNEDYEKAANIKKEIVKLKEQGNV